jgi:ABC-type branched-subunit amino acid transport system permease subunit
MKLELSKEKPFFLAFLALLFVLPFLAFFLIGGSLGAKIIIIASFCMIYLIASQALNIQVGYTGLLNLGAVAFVGIGGYTAAILLNIPAGHTEAILAQEIHNPSGLVVTASEDKKILLWNRIKGTKLGELSGHKDEVVAIDLSADGKTLVSAGKDKAIHLWNLSTQRLSRSFKVANNDSKLSSILLRSSSEIICGVEDGKIFILNAENGRVKSTLSGHYGAITSLQLSKNGETLLSGATDNRILLWKLNAQKKTFFKEFKYVGSKGEVFAAVFSPDEKSIFGGYGDRKARIWDVARGRVTHTFGQHAGPIEHISFSDDGQRLVLASRDSTMSVYDKDGRTHLATIRGHKGAIYSAAFTADGKQLVSSSSDKTTRSWTIEGGVQSQLLPIAPWALVAFYKNLLPQFEGHSRWIFFFLDSHFLAYLTVTPFAILCAALMGLTIGIPTLRLRGDYFAIVTLGFAQIFQLLVRNEEWLTSGPSGIKDLPAIVSFASGEGSIEFFTKTGDYFLGLLFFAISLFLMIRVRDSRMGRAFMAIRDDELAAQSNGIHLAKFKIYSFLISSAIAALAGVVLVARSKIISPSDLLFWESILYLCCIVLGGLGSVRGAVIGGVIIGGLGELMRQMIAELDGLAIPAQVRYILFAVILIVVMRYKPEGLHPAAKEETERGKLEAEKHRDVSPTLFSIGGGEGANESA